MRKYTFISHILRTSAQLFLVLLVPYNCIAQTFMKGVITDGKSGERLPAAHVSEVGLPQNGTLSNSEGYFELHLVEGNAVRIRYLGYEDTVIRCSSGSCEVSVSLQLSKSLLNQVVVSASKSRESLRSLTISMESIQPYLAESKNIVSLDKLAEQIPGVQVVDGQANIRAGSGWSYGAGSRVLVLLDGMPMMSGDAGQVLWDFLPLDGMANTEVIKGASSVLFGSSALNGVIHFQSRRPGKKPESAISAYGGAYSLPSEPGLRWSSKALLAKGINAWHMRKVGKHELSLSANYNADDGYRMGNADNRKRLGLRYRFSPTKNLALGLNSAWMNNQSGSFLLWQSLDSGYNAYNQEVTITKSGKFHFDPWLEWKKGMSTHKLLLRYLHVNNDIDNGNPTNDQSNESNLYFGDYQWTHFFMKQMLKVSGGAMGSYVISRSPLYNGEHEAKNAAAFIQADWRYKKWKLTGGGRWEYFDMDTERESRPVFRGGVNRQLSKGGFARASWGQGYRFPTIAERYITTSVGPLNVYSNPNLQSEKGWNAELGYKQAMQAGTFKILADISVFRMEYQNMIEFNFNQWQMPNLQSLGAGFKAINIGNARVDGVELSFMGEGKLFNGTFAFFGGAMTNKPVALEPDKNLDENIFNEPITYRSSSSDTRGNLLKYRSRKQLRFDLEYRKTRWMLGFSQRYNSSFENIDLAFVSVPLNLFIQDIEKGRKETSKHQLYTDLRFQYHISKQLSASLLVNNLFNQIYMLRPADLQAPRFTQLLIRYKIGDSTSLN